MKEKSSVAGYYYYPTSQPYYVVNPSYERPASRWNSDPEANLFIYNIPPRYSDLDLQNLFAPFGTVLSAKVGMRKGRETKRNETKRNETKRNETKR